MHILVMLVYYGTRVLFLIYWFQINLSRMVTINNDSSPFIHDKTKQQTHPTNVFAL